MYTQCPECGTTFKLGADDLRRANGKVRCGDCSHVFNALEYLAEEVAEDAAADTAADELRAEGWSSSASNPAGDLEPDLDEYEATAHFEPEDASDDEDEEEEDDGGSILHIGEAAEDSVAEEAAEPEAATADSEAEDTPEDDPEVDFDESLWENITGVAPEPDIQPLNEEWSPEDDAAESIDEAQDWQPEDPAESSDDEEPDDIEESDIDQEPAESEPFENFAEAAEDLGATDVNEDITAADDDAELAETETASEDTEPEDDLEFNVPEEKWSNFFGPLPKGQTASVWQPPKLNDDEPDDAEGDEAWDELTAGDSDDVDEVEVAEENEQAPSWGDSDDRASRGYLFVIGGLLLALGLTGQLIHYNRDRLAAHPSWGADVRALYESIGSDLYPEWSVSDYEIRGSEAVAGETGRDILDIRAQIANTGDLAVGLPRLRVVLRDRWSNPVAAQDFAAAEYSANLPVDRLLQPGDMVAAHVSIRDPGSGAQGFELELCLPRRNTGMECTGQPFK